MTIKQMQKELKLEIIQDEFDDAKITKVYTSDLLSDIMGNAPEESVLITIQAHKNTVAVATSKKSPAIIICNSRPIPDDMLESAKSEKIVIFKTDLTQFEISGKLYHLIKK